MTPRIPDAWEFVLLALAAYRVYRLIARDTITEPLRAATSYPDEQAITLDDRPHSSASPFREPLLEEIGTGKVIVVGQDAESKPWRVYLATLIRCPWCAGFYVSVAVWVAWLLWPGWALWAATPWAISAAVGLAKKNLDE